MSKFEVTVQCSYKDKQGVSSVKRVVLVEAIDRTQAKRIAEQFCDSCVPGDKNWVGFEWLGIAKHEEKIPRFLS